jgi:hypothetical protein
MSRGDGLDGSKGTPGALSSGCDKGGIGFENATTGFATGSCINGIYFAVTHDAGRTWQYPAFPLPAGVTLAQVHADTYEQQLGPPTFNGSRGAGTMVGTVVVGQQATHHDYIYFTTDSGAHWFLTKAPLRKPTWTVVVDATNWWSGNDDNITFTSDAGAHWTTVHPNLKLAIRTLQFTSPADGWALSANPSGSNDLVQTRDGGRTWRRVPVPTSPPRTGSTSSSVRDRIPVPR